MTVLETGRAETHLLRNKLKDGKGIWSHLNVALSIIRVVPYTSGNLKSQVGRVWVLDPSCSLPSLHQPALESSSERGAPAENSKSSYPPDTGKAHQCHFPQETRCKHPGATRDLPWWKAICNSRRQEHCSHAFPMPGWHSRIAFHLVTHPHWIVAGVLCSCANWSQWHSSPCSSPCWAGITSNSHREISAPWLHLDCNTHTHSSNKAFVKRTNYRFGHSTRCLSETEKTLAVFIKASNNFRYHETRVPLWRMIFDFGSGFIPATVCWRGCCPLCTIYWKDISYTFKIENKRKKKWSPKQLKLQLRETAKHTENETANANYCGVLFSHSYCASAANKENCCSCCGNTSLITHISSSLLAGCMYRCWMSPAPLRLYFMHNWEVKPQNKLTSGPEAADVELYSTESQIQI